MPVVWSCTQRKATHYTCHYKANIDHEAQTVGGIGIENERLWVRKRSRFQSPASPDTAVL